MLCLDELGHSHVTYAVVDKLADGTYGLRCLKQKQFVDGVAYLLQEIYGIENKNTERAKVCTHTHLGSSRARACVRRLSILCRVRFAANIRAVALLDHYIGWSRALLVSLALISTVHRPMLCC